MFVAFEWDHVVGSDYVRWVVIECAGVGELYGGIQALKPRRDVAYFVDPDTAEDDARLFAALKRGDSAPLPRSPDGEYEAFAWDHREGSDIVSWAVLKHFHPPHHQTHRIRRDTAYFLDAATAEADARCFAAARNRKTEPERLRAQ
jgi:hypothetical protein